MCWETYESGSDLRNNSKPIPREGVSLLLTHDSGDGDTEKKE